MSHPLNRQLTTNSESIIDVESSFSTCQRSLVLDLQGANNLQLHDLPSTTPTPPTTKTNIIPLKTRDRLLLFRQSVVEVGCACSNIWPRLFGKQKPKHSRFFPMSPTTATASEVRRGNLETGNVIIGGQQKKEDLQREVTMLQTVLNQEEKIREILQHACNRKPGIELTIPHNLPPKIKEVIDELVAVDDEIVQLESQIERLQKTVKSEQEVTKELRTKQSQNTSTTIKSNLQGTNDQQQRIGYETKALHFISKAINGSYSLTDFTINNDNIRTTQGSNSSSPYIQNVIDRGARDKVVAKRSSGMLKTAASPLREFSTRHPPATPMRDFRHPTPKPQERSPRDVRSEHPRNFLTGPAKTEEPTSVKKYQPNKLAEDIMKTLILLFVRLIRTSRQSELEKSGPISRSMFSSLSFRTEQGVNLSSSTLFQKESRQQDPYGVFNIEGAIPRDIGPYKNLVVFSSCSLDPKFVSHSSSIPLFQKLRGLLNSLQKVELRSLTEQQKLAFWINIYNACIMHGFLKFGVPSSPEKFINLLNKVTLNVGGKIVNAQAIERCILRNPTSSSTKENALKNTFEDIKDFMLIVKNSLEQLSELDSKETIIHELYGLGSINPNVIFTLCCGTRSSPAVRVYTADGITSELERSKLEYLLASISVTESRKIWLPELLIQNMQDFSTDVDSLVQWVCHQLPTSGSLRKSIVDCFKGHNNSSGRVSSVNVEKMMYEFEFQYLLQVT